MSGKNEERVVRETYQFFPTGSARWYGEKAFSHAALFLAPLVPLMNGISGLVRPTTNATLSDEQQHVLSKEFGHGVTVEQVTVRLDGPSVLERIAVAAPSLVFGAILALLGYALWRIEINLSATGRYTPRDSKLLRRAAQWTWYGWWAVLALTLLGASLFSGLQGGSKDFPFLADPMLFFLFSVSAVMTVAHRVYLSGKKAWTELQEGV